MIGTEEEAKAYCVQRVDSEAMDRFDAFLPMLAAENEEQNLVSRASLEHAWTRHVVDSLQLLDHVPGDQEGLWMDLGSGAGFPGLVIAMARPDIPIALVESRKRRIDWLERIVRAFSLENCRVEGMRLENVEPCEASVITARAFAPLHKLLDLSARFSTRSTIWLLPKGRSAAIELQEQSAAIRKMFHVEQSITDAEAAILVGRGRATDGREHRA